MSSSLLPASLMTPSFITTITSASRMVDRRCAMTNTVRFLPPRPIAFTMALSVFMSTELVASSRIIIGASRRSDLAMEICCCCPVETEDGEITVSSPSGRSLTYDISTESQSASSFSSDGGSEL